MNIRPTIILACLALAACLTSCGTTPEARAKQARYAAIGDGLLNLGVKTKYITPETAAIIREGGSIILETKATPVAPVTQPAPAPSGKEVIEVVPFAFTGESDGPARAYCYTWPAGYPPRTGRTKLS